MSLKQKSGALLVDHRANVENNEHRSNLLRLRRLSLIALIAWPLFSLGDWFITEFVEPGRLSVYLGLRAIGFALLVPAVLRIHSDPTPNQKALRWMETGASASLVALITLSTIEFRGIESPLVLGVMTILFARAATVSESYRLGLLPTAVVTLTYPLTLGLMSLASPFIAGQFSDAQALGALGLNLMFLLGTAALALVGGHAAFTLRKQAFEAKAVGRYKLVRKIGRGGMGEVWLARHDTLKRDVAVKVLAPEKKKVDDLAIARFEREVQATTELSHPNTIRIFDYGVTQDGLFYYAMEHLIGKDLAEVVRAEGPLESKRAAKLIWQAARALAEAHRAGIVHRDIKPENLFVTSVGGEKDYIKLLDFGLVQLNNVDVELTRAGWAVGTPTYIAPEVITGKKADARSDVYALGTVLYFLLTGETPFGARELKRLLAANVREEPKRPSERLGRSIPHHLENIVMACLEKDPAKRYRSGLELANALESFIHAQARYPEPRLSLRTRNTQTQLVAGGRSSQIPQAAAATAPRSRTQPRSSASVTTGPLYESEESWSDKTQVDQRPAFLAS